MPDNIFKIPGGLSGENKFLKKYLNPTPIKVGTAEDLFIFPEDWKKRINDIPREVWDKRQRKFGEGNQKYAFRLSDESKPLSMRKKREEAVKGNLEKQRKLAHDYLNKSFQPNILSSAHRNPTGRIVKFTPEEIEQAQSDPLLNYIIQKSSPLGGAGQEDMFLLPEGDVLSSVPYAIWKQEAEYRNIPWETAKLAAGIEFRDIANRKRNELGFTPETEKDAIDFSKGQQRLKSGNYDSAGIAKSMGASAPPQFVLDSNILLNRKNAENIEKPFVPYDEPRVAPFGPQQQQDREKLRNFLGKTESVESDLAKDQLRSSFDPQNRENGQIQNLMDQAIRPATSQHPLYQQFINPHQEGMMDVLKRRAQQRFEENNVNRINGHFISHGAYRSGNRNDMINRARRDMEQDLKDQEVQLMTQAHEKALAGIITEEEKLLNIANLSGHNMGRKNTSAEKLLNHLQQDERQNVAKLEGLNQLGEQERILQQKKMDHARQEFDRAQAFESDKLTHASEISRALPSSGHRQRAAQFEPQQGPAFQPSTSPWNMGGNIAGTMAGLSMMGAKHAHGGPIQAPEWAQHYADGGSVSPERGQMLSMAHDFINNRGSGGINPYGSFIANTFASAGANHRPGDAWGGMNKGLAQGVQGFEQTQHQNNAMKFSKEGQAFNAMKMIEDSRQHERNLDIQEQHNKDQLEMQKLQHLDRMSVANRKDKSKPHFEKIGDNIYEVKVNPETGEAEAKAIKGIEKGLPELSKVDEEILKAAEKELSLSNEALEITQELKDILPRTETGPIAGQYSGPGARSSIMRRLSGLGNEEDINRLNSLSNRLVSLETKTMPNRVTDTMLKQIQASKVSPTNTVDNNLSITKSIETKFMLSKEKSDFLNKAYRELLVVPSTASVAFNKYAAQKLKAIKEGVKFDKTPEDFLDDAMSNSPHNESNNTQISSKDEQEVKEYNQLLAKKRGG